jgi:DNA-binding transcriptional LysR family regulator
MIELTRLRAFREVARLGSFTAAGAGLGFSQPGISHQIAQLEREVGVPLIERSGRGITLTPAGEALLGHVEAILSRVADAERDLADVARVGQRRLQIASFATAATTVLPLAAGIFRRQLPEVALTLIEEDPVDSLPALAAGVHDAALAYDYPILAHGPRDGLDVEPLFVDQMCVALPDGHSLADATDVAISALADEPGCAPHQSICRDALELACRTAGFAPRVMAQTNDYMVMQGLVAAGAGIAVMPRLAAAITIRPGVTVRPLSGEVLERVTFLVTRSSARMTYALATLRDALLSSLAGVSRPDLPLEAFEAEGARIASDAVDERPAVVVDVA